MKAKKFDPKFDDGKDLTEVLDTSKARRPLEKQRRVNVDSPARMIESLDREDNRLGGHTPVNDQSLAGGASGTDGFQRAAAPDTLSSTRRMQR